MVANFPKLQPNKPSLLTHDDVSTLNNMVLFDIAVLTLFGVGLFGAAHGWEATLT